MRKTATLTAFLTLAGVMLLAISVPASRAESARAAIDLAATVGYDLTSDDKAITHPGQGIATGQALKSQSLYPGGGIQDIPNKVGLESQSLFPGGGRQGIPRKVNLESQSIYPATHPPQGAASGGVLRSQSLYVGGGRQAWESPAGNASLTSLSSWPSVWESQVRNVDLTSISIWPSAWVELLDAGGGIFVTPSGLLIGNGDLQGAPSTQARDGRLFVPVELLLSH